MFIVPVFVTLLCIAGFGMPVSGITSSFFIESSPSNASIYVDGIYKGETPLDVSGVYPPGRYPITLQKDGYIAWHTSGVVEAGKQTQISATLTPLLSTLTVTSTPAGAAIYLDGAPEGKTPATFESIMAGEHSLRLVLIGYDDWTTDVELLANQPITVAAKLDKRVTPYTGTLTVQSSPSRADVEIDGALRGQTPITLTDLPPGIHTVILSLEKYESWESEIQIVEGEPAQITATLTPLPSPTPAGSGLTVLIAAAGLFAAILMTGQRKR
jgi:hypothetical protein